MEFPEKVAEFISRVSAKYPSWDSELNKFFDRIGFTEPLPKRRTNRSRRIQSVKDNVWGMVEFDEPIARLIDNPLVQRLRGITQLGFSYLTYPTACHSRFNHALGMYAVIQRLAFEVDRTKAIRTRAEHPAGELRPVELTSNQKQILLRTAILHDIGHGPFSHVSEKVFSNPTNPTTWRMGPANISDLLGLFREVYLPKKGATRPQGNKKLTEIVSILLINSTRFKKYYDQEIGPVNLNRTHDLYNIGALILGDPLDELDFALPALVSSAIDADKIDYMLRDAHACGISLSIDINRTFHNAGIYELRRELDPFRSAGNPNDLITVFVIDKSGSDTYEQLGASRLSLYRRVYHHPFTRSVEAHFSELLHEKAVFNNEYADLLRVWTEDENSLLRCGLEESGSRAAELSSSYLWRQFPKKAAIMDSGSFRSLFGGRELGQSDDFFSQFIQHDFRETLLNTDFAGRVRPRIENAVQVLKASGRVEQYSLADLKIIRVLPPPDIGEGILGSTRLIDRSSNMLIRGDIRLPSYMDAGKAADDSAFLFIDEGWRELGAVALGVESVAWALARISSSISAQLDDFEKEDSEKSVPRNDSPRVLNAFVPLLKFDACAHHCKVDPKMVAQFLGALEDAEPRSPALWLLNDTVDETGLRAALGKIGDFQGAYGWKVNFRHASAYVRQFPSKLRDDVIELLGKHLTMLTRERVLQDISSAVKKLKLDKSITKFHLVPLTPTSGHTVLSFLKGVGMPLDVESTLHNSIQDALIEAKDGSAIVFFDDHSASGTQAANQLGAFVGQGSGNETNVFKAPLAEIFLNQLRKLDLHFAFACLGEDGATKIEKACEKFDLKCRGVAGGTRLSDVAAKGKIDQNLREFLHKVGVGLMLNKWVWRRQKGRWREELVEARKHALGYDNYEGTLITALNVPTSTYTALWRPGLYDPSGAYRDRRALSVPWVPLFLRSTQADRLVLY